MYVMSVSWHELSLQNRKITLEIRKKDLARLMHEIQTEEDYINFYTLQVAEAVKQGKKGFDKERFMKQKKPKV